jgi:hypothetical protein
MLKRKQETEIGNMTAARPDLLAVHEKVIALVLGRGAQAGQVRARIRLGVQLAPDLLGGEDLPEIPLLLPVRTVDDDGRPDEPDAEAIDGRRRVSLGHLVGRDGDPHGPERMPTVLLRPMHPDVTGLVHGAVPLLALVEGLQLLPRHVRFEPAPGSVAKL